MTKQEIVNYVVETPHNVNKNILGQQLDELQKNVSWNDLKDKPFYREVGTKVAVERQIPEFKSKGDWGDVFPITLPADIYDSKEVDILWGGVVYRISGADLKNHDFDSPDRLFFIREINGQVYFTTFDEHPSEIGITYTSEIVQQVPPMFVPNSVWTEEEVVLEERKIKHGEMVDCSFIAGCVYKVILDEETYICTAWDNGGAWLGNGDFIEVGAGEDVPFVIDERGYCTFDGYDDKEHIMSITKFSVKTNCDFMVDIKLLPNSIEKSLVCGSYATAKTKYNIGLPVTIYTCVEIWHDESGNSKEKMRHITYPFYGCYGDEEYFWVDAALIPFAIYPDNTVRTEEL